MLGLFRKKFSKLAAKGDRCFQRDEVGLARAEYMAALLAFRDGDDPAERARVEARLAEVTIRVARNQLDEAKRHLKASMFDRAFSILESVEELAEGRDEALRAEADALLSAMESGEIGEETFAGEDEDEEPAEPEEDPGMELELLIQTLPEARQEAYRAAGPDFRDGYLALNDGDAEAALASFLKAPQSPWRAYEIARAHGVIGDNDAATAAFTEAAEGLDDTQAAPVVAGLAQAAMAAGRHEEAEAAAERFATIEGVDAPDTISLRVAVLAAQERYDDADREARVYLKRNPSQLRVWRGLGELNERAGRPRKAIAAYERVMGLRWRFDPDRRVVDLDRFSTTRLAALLIDQGEGLERALTLLNALSLISDDPDKVGLAVLRSTALFKLGDEAEARKTLEEALEALAGLPEPARLALEQALAEMGEGDGRPSE